MKARLPPPLTPDRIGTRGETFDTAEFFTYLKKIERNGTVTGSATQHTRRESVERWYTFLLALVYPKYINPTTAYELYEKGYARKIPPKTEEGRGRMKRQQAEQRRIYQAGYYLERPEKFKKHNMSAKQRREAKN